MVKMLSMDQSLINALFEIPGAVLGNADHMPISQAPLRHRERLPEQILLAIDGMTTAPISRTPLPVGVVTTVGDLIGIEGDGYFLPELDPTTLIEIDNSGIEAIAYYLSFHVDPRRWGIYLLTDRLEQFAVETFDLLPISDAEKLMLGYRFVIDHELFHYWTDVACAQSEYILRQPVYLPYLSGHPDLSSKLAQLEEAIANARAWRNLPSRAAKDLAAVAMDAQPVGYCDWASHKTTRTFMEGKRRLGVEIDQDLSRRSPLSLSPHDWFFNERRPGASNRGVPLHRIGIGSRAARPYYLAHARPVVIEESERFVRALRKLPTQVQKAWQRTKSDLETGAWKGCKLGPLKGRQGVYACRVGIHHRAFFENSHRKTFIATDLRARQGAYK